MKDPLQVLLVSLAQVSSAELSEALALHPDSGVVEALGRAYGEKRESEILKSIAQSLKISFIPNEELEIESETFKVDSHQLALLAAKHKAVPLDWQVHGMDKVLRLAMADPLDRSAADELSALFQSPVRVCLAKERAITKAAAAMKKPQDVEGAKLQKKVAAASASGDGAANAVAKAIQQVTATAVKHGADKVEIKLEESCVHAEFVFEDAQRSSVDIQVSGAAFAGGLLGLGQVVERKEGAFEAILRVDFKASSVVCRATFYQLANHHEAGVSKLPCQALVLEEFSLDNPDDPNFWLSLSEIESLRLRDLFKERFGVLIIAAKDESTRRLALRALVLSYPETRIIEHPEKLLGIPGLEEELAGELAIAPLSAGDVFEAIDSIKGMPPENFKCLSGILSYMRLPRICEFCAESSIEVMEEDNLWLPEKPILQPNWRKGVGCPACGGKGAIGLTGICSLLEWGRELGDYLGAGAETDFAKHLIRRGFRSLWENGLDLARTGCVSFNQVLTNVARPPLSYQQAKMKEVAAALLDKKPSGHSSFDYRSRKERELPVRAEDEISPIGGSAVFTSNPYLQRVEGTKRQVLRHLVEPEEELSPTDPIMPAQAGTGLLLVIDDDPDQRVILRRVLEMEGYAVEVAPDGIDGIVSANRLRPSLIIVDFMMPDLDGKETIRRLKKGPQTASIPIIALTAYSDPDVEYGLLKAGADDFCPKSVAKRVLLKRIEKLMPSGKKG